MTVEYTFYERSDLGSWLLPDLPIGTKRYFTDRAEAEAAATAHTASTGRETRVDRAKTVDEILDHYRAAAPRRRRR